MKKIISIAIILVALSVSYFFVIFLPQEKQSIQTQEQQEFLFRKQSECKQICEKIYHEDRTDNQVTLFVPNYAYNKNLNTCFYSSGYIGQNAIMRWVKNCMTNEEVVSLMSVDGKITTDYCDTCTSSGGEFDMKKKEFMGF